ncbi:hypothetical protein BO221_19905 [Archangium sp. Cb G35]|uniref:FG-GAP-like repeat-containing protein n=1 Tax=Archangium sp. Cb G35 TaxID=1920190 RepID=UPI0009377F4F|nr:FG-GAP-like repeat-containing protein [Archangium sp. Cb G35]OJT23140.1 hypothetical protein BO221_19905 [Archangium sp. Cb G35]
MYLRSRLSGGLWGLALFALVMVGCLPWEKEPGKNPPGAPTMVSATFQPTRPWEALVKWNAPEDTGGSPILRYTVVATPGGELVTTGETSALFSAPLPGTYTFTVYATNAGGDGPPSAPSEPRSLSGVPVVSEAPTGVMATPGEDYVLVTWAHVDSGFHCGHFTNETCITSYQVTANPGGIQLTVEQPGRTLADYRPWLGKNYAVVTGLEPDTAYTFTVHATNSVGASPASSPTQPVTQQCTTFTPPVSLTTGLSTSVPFSPAIATGDLTGDGRPDVVVAGPGLSVLVNQGGTAFAEPVIVVSQGRFNSVALVELNGDGRMDIAALETSGLKVFLNAGDGTFSAPVSYDAGSSLWHLTAADVTGDTRTDLLLLDSTLGDDTLLVFSNNGDGTLSASVPALTGDVSRFAPGDVNRDGKVDLVVAGSLSPVLTVLLNAGDGTFTRLPLGSFPELEKIDARLALADMNGDGNLDLVSLWAVFLGRGDGTFQEPRPHRLPGWGWGLAAFAIGDVDADGALDMLTSVRGSERDSVQSVLVGLLRNDGQGGLAASSAHLSRPEPRNVLLDDLDGDRRLDGVVADTAGQVSLLRDCPVLTAGP